MLEILLNAEVVASGASITSHSEHLRDCYTFHALEYEITGNGTVALEILLTISGKGWVSSGNVATGLTKISGPGGDGRGHIDLFLKPAEFIAIKAIVTVAPAVVTVYMVQK